MPSTWLASFASPYLAVEGFYVVDDYDYNRTRLFIGAEGRFTQLLTVEVYYLNQSQRLGDSWDTRNAFGLKVRGVL
jgi:hypothetical protein